VETYRVGDRVTHDTWGLGRVIDLSEDRSLLVTFGGAHTQRVTVPYRKLQKL
jgi:transcription elongation factor GreA-like protein